MLQKEKEDQLGGRALSAPKNKNIAVVMSLFNKKIVEDLLQGCFSAFEEMGLNPAHVKVFKVAGAFEIPFMIKKIALSRKYDGLVALGCVIRGETPHFEYISLAATVGCLMAGLDTVCPVSFGVITADNLNQAAERSRRDACNKGREAVLALLGTLREVETI